MAGNDSFTLSVAGRARSKVSPFYNPTLDNLSKEARDLFENYSGIDPDRVVSHVEEIRDRAWAIFPYPCIGLFRFVNLSLRTSPLYPSILSRLKDDKQTFLDLGCCLGTEIRQLVADGAPSENIYGTDLRPEFWELGYELFRDKGSLKASFLTGDVFDPFSELGKLDKKVDILHAGLFFHLFSYDQQIEVAKKIVKLMRPVKGSLLLGWQVGSLDVGVLQSSDGATILYRHDEESWAGLWREVGEQTGVKFVVESQLVEGARYFIRDGQPAEPWVEDPKRLMFSWENGAQRDLRLDNSQWRKDRKLHPSVMGTKWSDVILSPSLKDSIMSDITTFFDYEEMYTSLIPWKRGIILHGTPRRSSVETTEGDDKDKGVDKDETETLDEEKEVAKPISEYTNQHIKFHILRY
ncbi:hypothetical protein VE01_00565 [Pseudogymnoascus verrucosus]|uniref:Methyltransferase domain-containing protein n=1 Tax=Pseudogymnoascus verrucosus TaxID=342668 RepID=A0A2P2SXP1_9PEZI|nr:uncharacterized protein VE01_00565 [Pseudogymnoascus verrucosus]OBU01593.2 hypothetical protein VE01_00565 [Pseudogymnoascus verrucosus]